MVNRILVPLDGSSFAEAILPQIQRLLMRIDAEVILFQAVYICPSFYKKDYTRLRREAHDRARSYLDRVTGKLQKIGYRVRFLVGEGPPPQAIFDAADWEQVDLIVMSTHGHSGGVRWVMGSVAEYVMQGTNVPVFLHRSTSGDEKPPILEHAEISRILVPVDGSVRSMEVLPHARAMARRFDSEILLLHVCATDDKKKNARELRTIEAAASKLLEPGDALCRTLKQFGNPASAILEAAKEHDIDLIAMTTHGENMKPRWTLGRVSEAVLQHTPVPMLVIRSKASWKRARRRKGFRLLQGAEA